MKGDAGKENREREQWSVCLCVCERERENKKKILMCVTYQIICAVEYLTVSFKFKKSSSKTKYIYNSSEFNPLW